MVRRKAGRSGRMMRWLTALVVASASGAVGAAEVVESTFQTEFTRDGQTYTDTVTWKAP